MKAKAPTPIREAVLSAGASASAHFPNWLDEQSPLASKERKPPGRASAIERKESLNQLLDS